MREYEDRLDMVDAALASSCLFFLFVDELLILLLLLLLLLLITLLLLLLEPMLSRELPDLTPGREELLRLLTLVSCICKY